MTFHGAARSVTGSKHLLTTPGGKKYLLDCGMVQGRGKETDVLNRHFGFDPTSIDAVLLSHAHIDHSGLLPRLVAQGFSGTIYCTLPTLELCRIMLADSAHIQTYDVQFLNKHRIREGKSVITPLYNQEDVDRTLQQMQPVPYAQPTSLNSEVSFTFYDAGHLLGSAGVYLELFSHTGKRTLHFTGDVGRYAHSILNKPAPFPPSTYIISESTYGDADHPVVESGQSRLRDIVWTTCAEQKGKLLIPAFSIGRTQEIVLELNKLVESGQLPTIPMFVDSPLSVNATSIVRRFSECYNDSLKAYKLEDADPFGFDQLYYITGKEDSMKLNNLKGPAVIISSSGMAEAGRIKHHLANHIGSPKNTVLIVGYCEPSSLGGRLAAGERHISIFGRKHKVNARVVSLEEYSAHGGQSELLKYFEGQQTHCKTMFLVHGEYEKQVAFGLKLEQHGFKKVVIPQLGETFALE